MAENKEKRIAALAGDGIYLYKNNGRADILLAKTTKEGYKMVAPGQQFRGDSHFKQYISQGVIILKDETPVVNEGIKMEEKLLLDQPATHTVQGKVESIMVKSTPQKQKLNETIPPTVAGAEDILITEDPMGGVEILSD